MIELILTEPVDSKNTQILKHLWLNYALNHYQSILTTDQYVSFLTKEWIKTRIPVKLPQHVLRDKLSNLHVCLSLNWFGSITKFTGFAIYLQDSFNEWMYIYIAMQFFGGKVDLEKKLRPSSNIQPIVSSSLHYHSEDVKYVKSGHPLSALRRHCQQYISASSEHNFSVAYKEFE